MFDDSQNLARGTVPAQATFAPFAPAAGKIDLADDTLPEKARTVCFDHFTDEFVPGRSGKTVIPAKKLEIRIADAAINQPHNGIALRASRP